jgi:hypothetical protein
MRRSWVVGCFAVMSVVAACSDRQSASSGTGGRGPGSGGVAGAAGSPGSGGIVGSGGGDAAGAPGGGSGGREMGSGGTGVGGMPFPVCETIPEVQAIGCAQRAGNTGVGGVAGNSGVGGVGGSLVPPSPDTVDLPIGTIALQTDTTVTVLAIEDVAKGVACSLARAAGPTKVLHLRATSGEGGSGDGVAGEWRLYLQIPDLPSTLINVGDELRLEIAARSKTTPFFPFPPLITVDQTVVLSRAGRLVLFTTVAADWSVLSFEIAQQALGPWGIQLGATGATCDAPERLRCGRPVFHDLTVVMNGERATISPGRTGRVGSLSVSVKELQTNLLWGQCDQLGARAQIAGFMPPATP